MIKKNEEQIHILKYELHYKDFIVSIKIRRSDMQWDYWVKNKFGELADWAKDNHFMGEQEIKEQMKTLIDDCIKNPKEYY